MFLLLRHLSIIKNSFHFIRIRNHCTITPNPNLKSSLSSRLSFVFDQLDAADDQASAKFEAVQKIRQWRENRSKSEEKNGKLRDPDAKLENSKNPDGTIVILESPDKNIFKNTESVELVHPWPEWIEFMDRLGQQNYFDFRKNSEDIVAESIGIDLSEVKEDVGFDFSRDWITVKKGCMNFGKARFDILRSLPKKDIQILVGHGCPSMDPKVLLSAKLLRKHVHLNEGDVCSSCSLRNTCMKGYILTRKEDVARTIDIMRILLTYAFDHVNGSVTNQPLMQMKSIRTVVRKLLHEVAKLSAVPIDPNLPPPVVKKPPPKVKQPPPQPRKRVGRDDVEMKKGDWLCPKCDFMNYAKNTVCLQCDANRPKRQLLPGEWECPKCNFLNYRRNIACLHCDAKRPPEESIDNKFQEKQPSPRIRAQEISNAWNLDFDDNESDGADVAAFEFADSSRGKGNTSDLDNILHERRDSTNYYGSKNPRTCEGPGYSSDDYERKAMITCDRTGFDDFDDEEVDNYDGGDDDDDVDNNSRAFYVSNRRCSEMENNAPVLEEPESFDRSNKNCRCGSVDDLKVGSKDDLGSGFRYNQRRTGQWNLGRKGGVSNGKGNSDSDDDLLLDSDSNLDDGMLHSSGNRMMKGNKSFSVKKELNFRKSDNFSGNTRREFRSNRFSHSNRR